MKARIRFFSTAVVAAMSVGLVACGGDAESPLAPAHPGPEPRGNAAIQGFVAVEGVSAFPGGNAVALDSTGIKVGVVGTSLSTMAEEDGFFELSGIVAGTATLRITGPGVDATLPVSGLVDGQVTEVYVNCSGNTAEVTDPPKSLTVTGVVKANSSAGTWLKVDSREVTTSNRTSVDKGGVPIKTSDIGVGWKVQVTGTVGKQNVLAAKSISVLSGTSSDPDEISGTLTQKHLDASGNPDYIVVDGQRIVTLGDTQTGGSTYWKQYPSWDIIGHQQFSPGMAVKVVMTSKNGQRVAQYVFKL